MTTHSRKPLIIPIMMILIVSSISLLVFFSAQQISIELPQQPEIDPNLFKKGSSFGGFIDVTIPFNISNNSPALLRDIRIICLLSVVSIENLGFFPDTNIVNVSETIKEIPPNTLTHVELEVYISSWIPILAIIDSFLVLDIDINLNYQLGPLRFPIHLVGRLQDTWKAPYSI